MCITVEKRFKLSSSCARILTKRYINFELYTKSDLYKESIIFCDEKISPTYTPVSSYVNEYKSY